MTFAHALQGRYTSTLSEGDFEFDVKINGVSTEDELQDTFLELVEENIN